MHIIGLTGSSGAGKTAVSSYLQAWGAGSVDADAVYRTLCSTCPSMLEALAAAFGDVLDGNGALDRPKLASIVFSNPAKLEQLNAVTFPFIRAASEERFAALAAAGKQIILYDAPTLFQTGADSLCQAVIGVIASRETRIRRIIERDHLSHAAACARIDSQPDEAFYRSRCRFIIENNGDLPALEAQARHLWSDLQDFDK